MSRTVDERVVSMQFDNKQFENNVQTSLGTLDKLKQSLRFDGAAKGFDNIGSAAKGVNMSPLANAVESVRVKFSALEVMAVTALANITNSAVNAGKRLVSAFTIEPIKSGFQEYETQINSVQTILANTESKGSTLQDVNRALAELNTYADKTIYNFTEMTRNIGTFTAAGIDLNTSVTAIKGIANLAAVSGSTSQQASTAMYQLSQALASGTVKLMDWNSVVNAGMGGQVFQDALKETARVHGIAIDDMIKNEGSFRETLQKGWLTSDILTETLSHFTMAADEGTEKWETYKKSLMDAGYAEEQAEAILKLSNTATDAATKVKTFSQLMDTLKEAAQSGWTKSWEIMIGDFEEAKGFLTDVSDRLGAIIGESADARNKVLSEGLSSGWKQLLNAGIADEEGYKETFKTIAKEHGVSIDDMISAEKKLDETMSDSEAFQKVLKTGLIDGTISADMLSESVNKLADKMTNMSAKELEAAGYTEDHVTQIKELSDGLKDGSISMDDFVSKMLRTSGRENIIQALWNSFNGLMSVIEPIKEAFKDIFPPITGEQIYKITERLRDLTANFKLSEEQAEKVKSIFKGLFSVLDIGFTFIKKVGSGIIQLLGNFTGLRDGILNSVGSLGDWLSNLRDSIKETDIFGTAVNKIIEFIQLAINKIKEFGSVVKEKFTAPGFEGFFGVVSKILETLKTVGSKIAEVASNIGKAIGDIFRSGDIKSVLDVVNGGLIASILVGIKKYINGITETFDNTVKFSDKIKEVLDTVKDSLQSWQQNLKADMLLKIAGAIGILAASLFVISSIDKEKLSSALAAITVLFGDLVASLAIINKINFNVKGITKMVTAMIGISVAVLILAGALKKLSNLSWEELAKGVIGVVALMAALIGASKIMATDGKKVTKGAMQMVIMAAAIKILASACKDLSGLSWEELAKGLAGVGALLAEIAIFLRMAKFGGKATSTAVGIVLISAALKILASVCGDFADMKWEEIGKGLSAVGVLLLELAAFTRLAGNAKHIISTGVAMIAVAAAMKIFADVMNDISKLSWEEIGKGLTAIGGALLLIAGAMNIMPKGIVTKSIGLIGVAAAIAILNESLSSMSAMSWEEIGKGLVTLGGSMLILAVGLNAMKSTLAGSAALLIAAAAFAIFTPILKALGNMSLGQIGKSLLALAGVFVVFGLAALVLQPMIPVMLALSAAMLIFGAGCALVGAGILAISVGLTSLAATIVITASSIIEVIKTIVEGLGSIIVSFCKAISESAPAIAEAFISVLAAACHALVESSKLIAETFFTLLVDALTILKSYIPQLVDLLVDVLSGLFDKLSERIPDLTPSLTNFVDKLFGSIAESLGQGGWDGLLNSVKTISLALLELSVAAKIISTIPIAGALTGIAGLAIVIAGIAGILSALGGLAQIPGFEWLIGEGSRILSQIGSAIGSFVGNIIGGISEGVTSTLPKMAENLSSFMEKIQTFVTGAKDIDESVLDGIVNLSAAVLCITSADIISGIASFITGGSSLTRLGEELSEFGPFLKAFSDSTAGIDAKSLQGVAGAAKSLADMTSAIPNEGGVAAWFAGENSISKFGTDLTSLGDGIKGFADATVGIDANKMTGVVNAAKTLADMTSAIPNEGGVAAWFAGENSISKFGTELSDLGDGLKGFADTTLGIDANKMTGVVNAAKILADMTAVIPNEGGVAAWFAGENSISKFGTELSDLGEGLKGFADATVGIDANKMTGVVNAAKTLANMTSVIPNEGGVAAWFAGDNSIANFGAELSDLGEGLKGFADATIGIDSDHLTGVTAVAKALADVANTIPNKSNLDGFGSQLSELGNGIKDFSDELDGVKTNNISDVIAAVKAAMNDLTDVAKTGTNGFVETFEKASPDVKTAVNALIQAIKDSVSDKGSEIGKTFVSIMSGVPNDICGLYADFYSAGTNLVDGFASGITDQTFAAEAAASAMASAALKAAEAVLKINSPSKAFYDVGDYGGEGFVNALSDYSGRAYKAGSGMANKALSGLSKAIAKINDIVNSRIDTQPTIRPVLDLSDVSSGVGMIDNMFGLNPSIGMMAKIGTISNMMNRNQNGANDDVITAIKSLGRSLNGRTGDTYNINGITYDDGSNIADAVKNIVRAARVERRT